MDYNDLVSYVNGKSDDAFIQACWNDAVTQVDTFIGSATVPDNIKDRCYLMCGSEMFHARQAPNGIAQYNEFNGAPVRIARDPMTPVYSLLAPYVVMGL